MNSTAYEPLRHAIQICGKRLEAPHRLRIILDTDIDPDFFRTDVHASSVLT
jgi:hypothetical protein